MFNAVEKRKKYFYEIYESKSKNGMLQNFKKAGLGKLLNIN